MARKFLAVLKNKQPRSIWNTAEMHHKIYQLLNLFALSWTEMAISFSTPYLHKRGLKDHHKEIMLTKLKK